MTGLYNTGHPMRLRCSMWTRPVAALAVLVLFCGCNRPAPTPAAPRSATTPIRVASLAPSITEIICALGGAGHLVGRSSACDYPPNVITNLPVVGEFGVPSMERLITAKPDIVFYTDLADETTPSRLLSAGIKPVHVKCAQLGDVPAAIRSVGQWLNLQAPATQLAAAMEQRIAACRARAGAGVIGRRPSVLVLIWHDPLTAAGRRSFLSELIDLAGGRNTADDVDRDYFPISGEWVASRNPDVIFCFFMSSHVPAREMILRRPGWQNVNAVRTGRVYDGMDNNLVLRPGPRMIQGLEAIEQRLGARHDKP